jgi:hypothetical protein
MVDEKAKVYKATSGFVVKKDMERRVVYGWASVIEVDGEEYEDEQGDRIGESELLTAAHKYVLDARAGKVMHEGVQIGEIVESLVFTNFLQEQLTIEAQKIGHAGCDLGMVGWFIGMYITDDETWERAKSGDFNAFSIGGQSFRVPA